MKEPRNRSASVGRVKTVIVFGDGPNAKAVTTQLVARWTEQSAPDRLRFSGELGFASETEKHIREVVLPSVDRICELLGLEVGGCFELSGVNLGAAFCQDTGVEITGFSADLAVFLVLLSVRLDLPLPTDFVCTGSLASPDGEIRLVRNLPLKLEAAKADRSVARFIYPAVDADASAATLIGEEREQIKSALAAKGHLKTIPVRDVNELLKAVLSAEAVVSAALARDYHGRQFPNPPTSGAVARAARVLGADMERRYWEVLKAKLLKGDATAVGRLLEEFARMWVRRRQYPQGFGRKLRQLIQLVPPSIRLRKLSRRLLPVGSCIRLSQCASRQDTEDVLDLYRAVAGGTESPLGIRRSRRHQRRSGGKRSSGTVEIVLAEIDKEHLTKEICLPIDEARASHVLDAVTTKDPVQALEIIISFYGHLLLHTNRLFGRLPLEAVGPKAQALLERTFEQKGGIAAALAEAQSGIRGGLRFVLDQMTEQFKRECQEEHIFHVIATAVNPLDWSAKVNFVKDFFRRCPGLLPAELASEPPERFARNYDMIVRLYVNALDEMKQRLRAM